MAFEAIIGQDRTIESLKIALTRKQVSHGYLIEGLAGLGKRTIARELAMGIVCQSKENKPCHTCQSCIKSQHGNHPEIKWIEPEGAIKIEQIRELQKEILMKPYEGKYKVFVLCNAETMTTQAQNALLKTLEEPPTYGVLILLVNNINRLLPTVASRCQALRLRPVEKNKIADFLEAKKGISNEAARVVAAFSDGIPGKALQLLEDEDFIRRRNTLFEITRELLNQNTIVLLDRVQFFVEEKNYAEELLDIFTSWYRDLLIYRETQAFQFIMNYDKMKEIQEQASKIGLKQLREIIFMIDKAKQNLKSNVNYQLNFEVMLLNIQEVLSW
ncbi:DNA polymerase III subunit delta' [Alkaliphilus crotonatoxidans]